MTEPRFFINPNGDKPSDIRNAFNDMYIAALRLRETFMDVRSIPLHGRNYQTLGELASEARASDMTDLAKFDNYVQEMLNWSAAGYHKAMEKNNENSTL
jgi:hypothetical protein